MDWLSQIVSRSDPSAIAAKAAIFGAVLAVSGVILTGFVTFIVARRNLFVTAVTTERSKWIDKLRENLATCSGALRTLSYQATSTLSPEARLLAIREINRLISLIRLQLNPRGEIDKNILDLLKKMPALAESSDGTRLIEADDALIAHSQWLLKAEWEKVKYEPRGIFSRFIGFLKAISHLRKYRAAFLDPAKNIP